MTGAQLQTWLYEESLHDELQQLTVATALLELDNVSADASVERADFDWSRLLLAASILARSEKREHKEAGLRIATGAMLLADTSTIKDAAAVLLHKLSNHRTAALAEERGELVPNLEHRLGLSLRLENQRKQLENSVLLQSTGERLAVNEFQLAFWSAATTERSWLSVSAPTASGKTFLVLKWLIDALSSADVRSVIYIAPTRALVSEIELSLEEIIAEADLDIEVSSLPSAHRYNTAKKASKKCVFVFTQERLHLLANMIKDDLDIQLVVIDEAHKIGDTQRGVILQDAIERLLRASPSMRAVFVSPATQNPEVLLDDAPASAPKLPVDSDVATVLQNIVTAHQVPAKPTKWNLALRYGETYNPLGILTLPSKPNTLKKRLAFIAAAIGERGGTLVYANGAAEAEDIAELITQLIEKPSSADPDLVALAELARTCVHDSYRLAALVERGVAFHYGNMPSLIRLEIERLFKIGRLKFLVCTSTLVEGVNLSCRTIIVRGPRKGKGTPMAPQDFWNLAGRAGRWGNEFQGNIICIDASDLKVWPTGIPQRTRYPIRRETDAALSQAENLAAYISARAGAGAVETDQIKQFEQVSSYLAATFLREGTLTAAPWAKRLPQADVVKLEETLQRTMKDMKVSRDIGSRNPGVSLFGLERLLTYFRSYPGQPEDLLLAPSESDDAYERFTKAMELINRHVLVVFKPETLIPLHTITVLDWMRGLSLPTIIRKRLEYLRKRGQPVNTPKVIRDTLEMIDSTARFLAPRYFSAYVDVLNQHLAEIGRTDLIDFDLDIGIALEFGVTSITMRSLMELGMSRISAVALYERIALDNLDEAACIAWITERADHLVEMGLPAIVLREVEERITNKYHREGK